MERQEEHAQAEEQEVQLAVAEMVLERNEQDEGERRQTNDEGHGEHGSRRPPGACPPQPIEDQERADERGDAQQEPESLGQAERVSTSGEHEHVDRERIGTVPLGHLERVRVPAADEDARGGQAGAQVVARPGWAMRAYIWRKNPVPRPARTARASARAISVRVDAMSGRVRPESPHASIR